MPLMSSVIGFLTGRSSPLARTGAPSYQAGDPMSNTRRLSAWDSALRRDTVPDFVQQRMAEAGQGRTPWVSTTSVAELGLARSHGLTPVTMVSGTCWWHYGFSWTRGHAEGWNTAIARMVSEARAAGANAILDVRMRTIRMDVNDSMDFTVIGTAFKVAGLPPSPSPIIATVPALEFVRLLEVGIVPVGIAVGAQYDWLYASSLGNSASENNRGVWRDLEGYGTWRNCALPELGNFWDGIRHRAVQELVASAKTQGNGVLADTHFGQLLAFGEEGTYERQYLGRHIVMGTVVDTKGAPGSGSLMSQLRGSRQPGSPLPGSLDIGVVVDMQDGWTPLNRKRSAHHTAYGELNEEEGEI